MGDGRWEMGTTQYPHFHLRVSASPPLLLYSSTPYLPFALFPFSHSPILPSPIFSLRIAQQTGGEYYKSVDEKTLDRIYAELGKKLEREKEDTSIKDWFFGAAMVVLVVELYLRYGRGRIIQ